MSGDALGNTSSTRHGADGVKKRSSSRDSSRGSSRPTSEGHRHKTEEVERQLNNRALKGSERPHFQNIHHFASTKNLGASHAVEEIMTDKKRRQIENDRIIQEQRSLYFGENARKEFVAKFRKAARDFYVMPKDEQIPEEMNTKAYVLARNNKKKFTALSKYSTQRETA